MKALIPAAGLGTRFLPATKVTPKELLPVLNKPVIQYVVEEALEPCGVDGVVIINSHEKPQIDSYFKHDDILDHYLCERNKSSEREMVSKSESLPIHFVYQDEPLGLGHAVFCAHELTADERFFVLLGDYFVPDRKMCVRMKEISDAHNDASVIAVARVPEDQVSRYGIIAGKQVGTLSGYELAAADEEGAVWKISGLVEKPKPEDAPSRLFIVGRYLLTPRVMELLSTQSKGAGGEIQLTDSLARLLETEEMYALVVDINEGCDTGTPAAWAATNARMALLDPDMRGKFIEALASDAFDVLKHS